jgi:hypothetical protein
MEKKINIVCLDNPFPANYGGAIDIMGSIEAFAAQGYDIILHVFYSDRKKRGNLEKLCKSVIFYKRSFSILKLFGSTPFILQSRSSNLLLKNLKKNNYPILFHGLHTTYWLAKGKLKNRITLVRAHNCECDYYNKLAKAERNIFKKIYLNREANKLKEAEMDLSKASAILCICKKDIDYFRTFNLNTYYIPAFLPPQEVSYNKNQVPYILYHGNLRVSENVFAVRWLAEWVFPKVNFPIVVAGKSPRPVLKSLLKKQPQVSIISNPSKNELDKLIKEASICLLPTFQDTGIKLKLLISLYHGNHCLVTPDMISGTELHPYVRVCRDANTMVQYINRLVNTPLPEEQFNDRIAFLNQSFNGKESVNKITEILEKLS